MDIFRLIKGLFGFKDPGPGLLPDTRTDEEKSKDYKFDEIVITAEPVTWVEKTPDQWVNYTIRNQDGSNSCVMQAMAKVAEVMYENQTGSVVPFSAGFYRFRPNFPGIGMYVIDAFNLWKDKGLCIESVLPSQNMSEAQMNAVSPDAIQLAVSDSFKVGNYVQFVARQDFEKIASTIQKTKKGILLTVVFDRSEWTDIPQVLVNQPTLGHAIVAVDTTLYRGKKYLVIEDSWGKFNQWNGKRLISEEFFAQRSTSAFYPINFKLAPGADKPQYTFTKSLSLGQTDPDIVALQNILKYEGLFPTNVDSTGYYGAVTAKAIYNWQVKHNVASQSELDALAGQKVGQKTIDELNGIYTQ